jgi:hypothetical protein
MRPENILDEILGNKTKVKLLRAFFTYPEKEFSEGGLQRIARVPQASVNRNVKSLLANGLLERKRIGKVNLYSVNKDHVLHRTLRRIFEDEKDIIETLRGAIEEGIKEDFEFIKDSAKGVLLFGSHAAGKADKRSDIDICLVRPKDKRVLIRAFERLGDKYDIKIFEELPLSIKIDVIKNHRTIFGDEVDLSYYFYRFRKEWRDAEARIRRNRFKSARDLIKQRRAWLDERKIPQKA